MTIVTVRRAVINLGNMELDVFQKPDGKYVLSETGCEKAVNKGERSIRDFLRGKSPEVLPFKERTLCKHSVEGEKTRILGLPVDMTIAYWIKEARKGNGKAQEVLRAVATSKHPAFASVDSRIFASLMHTPKPARINNSRPKPHTEAWYCKKLQQDLGGSREVPTDSGNIDLLTSTEVIELKEAKNWKGAIGQVLVYGHYYPSHSKRIHLFGDCHEKFLAIVQEHCDRLGILLTWEL